MNTSRALRDTLDTFQSPRWSCDATTPGREPATILVVEDHEMVRALVQEILASAGYRVLSSGDGLEAWDIIATYPGPLQLLLTDMVLPFLNGQQLSERASAIRSPLKTLYMSGYPETSLRGFGLSPSLPYLQKPFTSDQLINKVEEVLSAPTDHKLA